MFVWFHSLSKMCRIASYFWWPGVCCARLHMLQSSPPDTRCALNSYQTAKGCDCTNSIRIANELRQMSLLVIRITLLTHTYINKLLSRLGQCMTVSKTKVDVLREIIRAILPVWLPSIVHILIIKSYFKLSHSIIPNLNEFNQKKPELSTIVMIAIWRMWLR